jgi:GTP-binding protein HflX
MSKASKLQLEIAYLKYIKTRLVRGENNTILSLMSLFQSCYKTEALREMEIVSAKARGSSGSGKMSGEGETQLELERRLITDREAKLRAELKETQELFVKRQKDPSLKNNPTVAIIGYTNAGKTALMNHYTGAKLVSENMLFQTLNTTARRLMMPCGTYAVLLDTVGFISDLPHELVEAFKSTLEGVLNADLLLHIRDISHPYTEVQKKTVFQVLKDLDYPAEKLMKRYLEVWNKIDLLDTPDSLVPAIAESPYPIVPISAKFGINCDTLLMKIDELSLKVLGKQKVTLKFPLSEYNDRIKWMIE